MQTITPYGPEKTAEIMSRYRPIAPKPQTTNPNLTADGDGDVVWKSPYLRTVWAQLQDRPTRTRKRGRIGSFSSPSAKRGRACLEGLLPRPAYLHPPVSRYVTASFNFAPIKCCGLAESVGPSVSKFVELELSLFQRQDAVGKEKRIDLNLSAATEEPDHPPAVVSPTPVRPIGSIVLVERIISDDIRPAVEASVGGAGEMEEIVETERAPAIVSDSSNRVRMCNAAYKELVGQPECGWLDCAGGRIGGGISLQFAGPGVDGCVHGFRGRVRIEWESEGVKRRVIGLCEGWKLWCDVANDYRCMWRFVLNGQVFDPERRHFGDY